MAEVAVMYSISTRDHSWKAAQTHAEEFLGWTQTLSATGVFFETILDHDISEKGSNFNHYRPIGFRDFPNFRAQKNGSVAAL